MFVLTVDQIDSTHRADILRATTEALRASFGRHLTRAPSRTAGDEFQLAVEEPRVALDVCLTLTRDGRWSVGCGIGEVDQPFPRDVRGARGPAFVAARRAVDLAKKSVTRCVVRVAEDDPSGIAPGPLLDLLLLLRARRSAEGWEVFDMAQRGMNQREMAEHLAVSEQAVSARMRAADVRAELAARDALAALFAAADTGRPTT